MFFSFFFFNDTATTEIYTLSLHDALPISLGNEERRGQNARSGPPPCIAHRARRVVRLQRSEEHTSELQSQSNLVCRLLLEKKKNNLFPTATNPVAHSTSTASAETLTSCSF